MLMMNKEMASPGLLTTTQVTTWLQSPHVAMETRNNDTVLKHPYAVFIIRCPIMNSRLMTVDKIALYGKPSSKY